MSLADIISLGFGLSMFILICWVAWRMGKLTKTHPEDGGAQVADARVESIRQTLDEDRTELRASDFAALEPRPHIRAGTK